jgi:cysteine synthase
MSAPASTTFVAPHLGAVGRGAVHAGVLDLIGNTPVVDVSELSPNPGVRIVAKLEMQNPFGSVKDRIAKAMIEQAERTGQLHPGQTIVEPSSGNTGIALAAIARLKGYPIKILMPTSVSVERRQMLEIMGAEIILTPGEEGSNGAVRRAEQLAAEHPEWCLLYQYGNDANPRAHYEGTGPEIWRDVPGITHFVAGLGTSGTFVGTGRRLRELIPDVRLVSVQPESPLHAIEGLKHMDTSIRPGIYDPSLADENVAISTERAQALTRRLATEEGLLVGVSSGAALAASLDLASRIGSGVIVTVFPDSGSRYLSEPFWDAEDTE